MIDHRMAAIIIVISAGLLCYWISRVRILLHGAGDEIQAILETDLSRGRRVLLGLWTPPIQLVG